MSREHVVRNAYRRIDNILGLVNQGLTPEEIDRQLKTADLRRKVINIDRIRGLNNEAKVARLLKKAPYVDSIERTEAWSPQDREGYDLYAYLRGVDPLDAVGVQVKSSQRGINEFLRDRGRYLGGQGDRNASDWLFGMRLVMINGSLTDETIIQSFVKQVEGIAKKARFEQSQQAKEEHKKTS